MVNAKVSSGGVYRITNLRNGKIYIGSAVHFDKRWYEHKRLLHVGQHKNRHLQAAWNKYGYEAFSFEVLELMELSGTSAEIKAALIEAEQRHIDALKSYDNAVGYNINIVATSRLGVKASAETRARIGAAKKGKAFRLSIPHTQETKERIRQAATGKTWTAAMRAKFTESRRGRPHSDEHVEALRQAARKRHGADRRDTGRTATMFEPKAPRTRTEAQNNIVSQKLKGKPKSSETAAAMRAAKAAKASGDPLWFTQVTYANARSAYSGARKSGYLTKQVEVVPIANGRFGVVMRDVPLAGLAALARG